MNLFSNHRTVIPVNRREIFWIWLLRLVWSCFKFQIITLEFGVTLNFGWWNDYKFQNILFQLFYLGYEINVWLTVFPKEWDFFQKCETLKSNKLSQISRNMHNNLFLHRFFSFFSLIRWWQWLSGATRKTWIWKSHSGIYLIFMLTQLRQSIRKTFDVMEIEPVGAKQSWKDKIEG